MDSKKNFPLPTLENKRFIYAMWFSSKTNTLMSFKDKIELYTLICFLTQQMKKKDPVKYGNPIKVLNAIYKKNFEEVGEEIPVTGENEYILGLGIVCEDLLYGTEDTIPIPSGFKNAQEIVNRIKQLIEQWLPF